MCHLFGCWVSHRQDSTESPSIYKGHARHDGRCSSSLCPDLRSTYHVYASALSAAILREIWTARVERTRHCNARYFLKESYITSESYCIKTVSSKHTVAFDLDKTACVNDRLYSLILDFYRIVVHSKLFYLHHAGVQKYKRTWSYSMTYHSQASDRPAAETSRQGCQVLLFSA